MILFGASVAGKLVTAGIDCALPVAAITVKRSAK
jgi:hypothetical protein